ncbi:MAG TPA: carbohydrate ABC transporter permease, partial [bacterium]|nr:carbohydrate ABC transporter permease [bacterium]
MRAWRRVRRGILYAAVGMIVVVSLAPVAWLFISSMSPDVELNSSTPHWIPQHPTTIRYRALFSEGASDGL